jgi:hypothetical protein
MKAPTDGKRQWLWFAGLWCAGVAAAAALSYAARWLVSIR